MSPFELWSQFNELITNLSSIELWPQLTELFMNQFPQRRSLAACMPASTARWKRWKTAAFLWFSPGLTGGHTVHIPTRHSCQSWAPRQSILQQLLWVWHRAGIDITGVKNRKATRDSKATWKASRLQRNDVCEKHEREDRRSLRSWCCWEGPKPAFGLPVDIRSQLPLVLLNWRLVLLIWWRLVLLIGRVVLFIFRLVLLGGEVAH